MPRINLGALVVLVALSGPAFGYEATVVTCHDGDTCTVVAQAKRITVRVHAIDAPEIGQPYGVEARGVILKLIPPGTQVDVRPTGDASYHRTVADIVRGDGVDVGEEMVREGAAWVEARWNTNPQAPPLQAAARAAHTGLWGGVNPVAPWVWRHENRGN